MLFVLIAACASSVVMIVVALQRRSHAGSTATVEQFMALGASPQVAYYQARHDRLNAVKAYRAETGLGLREAASYVDEMMKRARG